MNQTEQTSMEIIQKLKENVGSVIVGRQDTLDLLLTALLSGGHVLLEDVPGTGKTMMAKAISKSMSLEFSRIQFTPDLLPSDVTGLNFFDQKESEFVLQKGPVFTHILLADEINRATPRTQSSLLEAMEEHQVTIDGDTYVLEEPFFVIATQNPVETAGTYPLPEAQLDRFLLKISMGYPSREEEYEILNRRREGIPVSQLQPVGSAQDVMRLREQFSQIKCAPAILNYIVQIAQASRQSEDISLGVSPRGSIALMEASMARAMLQGRGYVLPEDVKAMAGPVLAHRIRLNLQASMKNYSAGQILQSVLSKVPVPGVGGEKL